MAHTKNLSIREKTLAAIVVVLLAVIGIVTYSQAFRGGANSLVADEPAKQNDTENQQRWIKDQNNWLKNEQSELKDIKRQKVDTSVVDGLYAQFASCVQARQAEINTENFWNNTRDCQSIQQDIGVQMNDVLRPARDCANTKKNIEDRRKEKKNIDSQLKDILRQDKTANVSALTAIVDQINALFTKADQASSGGTCNSDVRDTLNDIQNEFNSLFQDFYSSSNEVNQKANEGRQLKDNKKDYEKDKKVRCEKDKAKELKNFEKELNKAKKQDAGSDDMQAAYDSVKDIYTQMCVDALGVMKTALDTGNADAYNEARSTYDDLDRTFWDTLNENRQGVQEKTQKKEQLKNVTRELKRWTSELKKMKSELNRTKQLYTRTAKKYANGQDRKTELAAFADYVVQAEGLIKQIESGLAAAKKESASDPEAWWMDRQDEVNDLQQQFYEMQQNVQTIGNVMQGLAQVEKDLMKGTVKELAQLKRESNNDPELMDALNDIIRQGKDALKQAWSQVVSSPEDAMAVLEGMKDLGQMWQNTVDDWRGNKQGGDGEELQ
ncbi:hypothetical protein HZA40_04650 [Candidatus Peregrinibacteria bacterium]|nr:hypothetical protein [Candidatus Peregrinibacteria bacterium]